MLILCETSSRERIPPAEGKGFAWCEEGIEDDAAERRRVSRRIFGSRYIHTSHVTSESCARFAWRTRDRSLVSDVDGQDAMSFVMGLVLFRNSRSAVFDRLIPCVA